MNGKRKFYMFFGVLLCVTGLTAAARITGDQLVAILTIVIPSFVLGNAAEHLAKKTP